MLVVSSWFWVLPGRQQPFGGGQGGGNPAIDVPVEVYEGFQRTFGFLP
jgi:hypothetical protein